MSQPSAEIVAMQWFDVADVADLEEAVYPDDAWSEATWWAELAGRPRRHYVIARSGDGPPAPIAGYAGIDINGDHADVMTIAVAPQHRGTGLGSLLLTRMHDAAREAKASAVLLEVRADNSAALALYARHGYDQISVRRRYYQSGSTMTGDVDAIVMRRALTEAGGRHA